MITSVYRFKWEGDLSDDCWCKVGNILAHCENMAAIKWRHKDDGLKLYDADIWFVSVGPVTEEGFSAGDDLFISTDPGGLIIGGEMARAIAESILAAHFPVNQPPPTSLSLKDVEARRTAVKLLVAGNALAHEAFQRGITTHVEAWDAAATEMVNAWSSPVMRLCEEPPPTSTP